MTATDVPSTGDKSTPSEIARRRIYAKHVHVDTKHGVTIDGEPLGWAVAQAFSVATPDDIGRVWIELYVLDRVTCTRNVDEDAQ